MRQAMVGEYLVGERAAVLVVVRGRDVEDCVHFEISFRRATQASTKTDGSNCNSQSKQGCRESPRVIIIFQV